MTKILLLNGPPRSGKDTIGAEILDVMTDRGIACKIYKFAHALKIATHGCFFGLQGVLEQDRDLACDPNAFEDEKDEPHELFYGLTPRQAYIAMSELLCKPSFGVEFFGEVLAKQIKRDVDDPRTPYVDLAIVTDSGFAAESRPLIHAFGPENVGLIRVSRKGCTFSGDSRGAIFLPELGDRQVDYYNFLPIDEIGVGMVHIIEDMFGVLRS